MNILKTKLKQALSKNTTLPFAVYTSVSKQHIFNVPLLKPLFICVIDGRKEMGDRQDAICRPGEFLFHANVPSVEMRNIPEDSEYFALVMEFDHSDFDIFDIDHRKSTSFIKGAVSPSLAKSLEQFIDWVQFGPEELWPTRRKELLQLLFLEGYSDVVHLLSQPSFTHQVEQEISKHMHSDITAQELATKLAMSESTLRRKLKSEKTHFQQIKDRTKLSYGLHLLQTTTHSIGMIAEQCGYLSQSRFTEKFKAQFHLKPSALRKTQCSK